MLRMVGELLDDRVQILGDLLPRLGAGLGLRRSLGKEPLVRRRVTLPQFFRQRFEFGGRRLLDLVQKTLDGHAHQPRPPERGHVAEHMRGVDSLPTDIQLQHLSQRVGDMHHDGLRQGTVPLKQRQIPLEGALRDVEAGFQVQGILHVGAEQHGLHSRRNRPVLKLLDEHQSGHRIQFRGRPPEPTIKVPSQLLHREQLQNHFAKQSLPAVSDPLPPRRRNHAGKRIKQNLLSRISSIAPTPLAATRLRAIKTS